MAAARAREQVLGLKPVCTQVQLRASARPRSLAKRACRQAQAQLLPRDVPAWVDPPFRATQAYTRVPQSQPADARALADPPFLATQAYTPVPQLRAQWQPAGARVSVKSPEQRLVQAQLSAAQRVVREGGPEA
jgi:hypothetical protein